MHLNGGGGETVKMSFKGKTLQEMSNRTEY